MVQKGRELIERLDRKDLKEAALVYKRGVELEVPSGNLKLKKILRDLDRFDTFVYKQQKKY